MPARRSPAPDARADAAARRLRLIAADAGGPGGAEPEEWWADHTRLAGRSAPVELTPAPPTPPPAPALGSPPAPPPLPRPGRHAARRRWRPALPAAQLPGLGPAHVAVVAVVVAIGLAVTTWWVARDRSEPVAPLAAEPAEPLVSGATLAGEEVSTTAGAASTTGSAAQQTGSVTVDVAGKVRRPGIVVLHQGARVTDALEAAGGARHGVDLTPINLARVLVDGEQIVVGSPGGAAPAGGSGSTGAAAGSASGASGAPVNLNIAAQAELETLPGVGPVTAQAIIAWREQHGGFTSIDELLEVDGIGEKTLATLSPHVTV